MLFAGIRCIYLAADYRTAEVSLRLHWYNRNYVGTHFGGSLFSMTDPWYMLLLMQCLGREYWVWDRRATIDFMHPGRGRVTARFVLDDAILAEIREHTAAGEKYLPTFSIEVNDEAGQLVAQVVKTVYVKRKPTARMSP